MMYWKDSGAARRRAGNPAEQGHTLAERIFAGAVSLWLIALVNVFGQIAVVPIALKYWGPIRWGEWVALTAIVGFLTLSDLGIQAHVVNRMATHHAHGDQRAFLSDLHSSMRIQWPLILGLWLLGSLIAWFLPINRWYSITTVSASILTIILSLSGAEILFGVAFGPVTGVYRATGRLARGSLIAALQRIGFFALPIALIAIHAGFLEITAVRLGWALLFGAVMLIDLRRTTPWFSLAPLTGSLREGTRMLAPSLLFLLANVSEFLAVQGTIMIIQSALGGASVAQFSTHRTLANFSRMLATQLVNASWPELTTLYAKGERGPMIQLHRTMSKLSCVLLGTVTLVLFPIFEWIYSAWTLRSLSLNVPLLSILLAQTLLWSVWNTGYVVLSAISHQGKLSALSLSNGALTVAAAFLLVPRYGIAGAALGSLVVDILITAWAAPLLACKAIGDTWTGYAREVLPTIAIALGIPAALCALCVRLIPSAWLWTILIPPLALLSALWLLWIMLTPAERASARTLKERIKARLA